MSKTRTPRVFYGWRVVAAVFVLAMFGWGLGFYGPPVYLHAVRAQRGWSLPLVSSAVTVHFLFGALVVAFLPRLYRRFGVPGVTTVGSVALAAGVVGWAIATEPWHLFVATMFSGGGWVTMGAAAVNAIVAPWFVRLRPAALSSAYNGASVGGIVFSPLLAVAIGTIGFPWAAATIGAVMIVAISLLSAVYFSKSPAGLGLSPDGDEPPSASVVGAGPTPEPLPGRLLWRDLRFLTLAAGMALGLFAQVGLLAHLFSLLVPALGVQTAGVAAGAATASAIAGRTLVGWLMPAGTDRRVFASASYGVQILGSLALLLAAGESVPLLLLGVALFGFGIGNATSLPPLIAQVEFAREDASRVVPMIVAVGQATYAFAPAVFGVIQVLVLSEGALVPDRAAAAALFATAAAIQAIAIVALLLGRRITSIA